MSGVVLNPWRVRSSSLTRSDHQSSCESLIIREDADFTAHTSKRWNLRSRYTLLIHLGLVCFYTVTMFIILQERHNPCSAYACDTLAYSPAQEAVAYQSVTLDSPLGAKSPYVGEPRPGLEQAWNRILKYTNIRLRKHELNLLNRTSIPLNDKKGGFLATLDVFHQLHCLNILRRQIYRDFYPDKHTVEKQLEHADHCIDILRQVLVCHGDISVQTYTWIDDYRWPWPKFNTKHECRKWDLLLQWADERYIPSLTGPVLTHPQLGVSYRGDGSEG